MDRYEYEIRAKEIVSLYKQGEYAKAVKIVDTIDWKRVKGLTMLCRVSDIYRYTKRYRDSRDILLMANEISPNTRRVIYALCELSILLEDPVQAVNYFEQYKKIAPYEVDRFILQYKIYELHDVALEERIAVLENYKKYNYDDPNPKWALELAYLYHRIGLATRCVEECDELILWFGDGKYVYKAMELKMLHAPLTPAQQEKYNARFMEEQEAIALTEMEPDEEENTRDAGSPMSISVKNVEPTKAKTTRIPSLKTGRRAYANPAEEEDADIRIAEERPRRRIVTDPVDEEDEEYYGREQEEQSGEQAYEDGYDQQEEAYGDEGYEEGYPEEGYPEDEEYAEEADYEGEAYEDQDVVYEEGYEESEAAYEQQEEDYGDEQEEAYEEGYETQEAAFGSEEPEDGSPEEGEQTAEDLAHAPTIDLGGVADKVEEAVREEVGEDEEGIAEPDVDDIRIKTIAPGNRFDTMNLEEETTKYLAKEIVKLMEEDDMEAADATRALPMNSIFHDSIDSLEPHVINKAIELAEEMNNQRLEKEQKEAEKAGEDTAEETKEAAEAAETEAAEADAGETEAEETEAGEKETREDAAEETAEDTSDDTSDDTAEKSAEDAKEDLEEEFGEEFEEEFEEEFDEEFDEETPSNDKEEAFEEDFEEDEELSYGSYEDGYEEEEGSETGEEEDLFAGEYDTEDDVFLAEEPGPEADGDFLPEEEEAADEDMLLITDEEEALPEEEEAADEDMLLITDEEEEEEVIEPQDDQKAEEKIEGEPESEEGEEAADIDEQTDDGQTGAEDETGEEQSDAEKEAEAEAEAGEEQSDAEKEAVEEADDTEEAEGLTEEEAPAEPKNTEDAKEEEGQQINPIVFSQSKPLPAEFIEAVQVVAIEAAKEAAAAAAAAAAKEAAVVAASQAAAVASQAARQAAQEAAAATADAIKDTMPAREEAPAVQTPPPAEDQPMVEKQITGQLSFRDIIAGWEEVKKENEQKAIEEMKQKVIDQTGPLFSDFESPSLSGSDTLSTIAPVIDVFDTENEPRDTKPVFTAEEAEEEEAPAEEITKFEEPEIREEETLDESAQAVEAEEAKEPQPEEPVEEESALQDTEEGLMQSSEEGMQEAAEEDTEDTAEETVGESAQESAENRFNTAEINGLEDKLVSALDGQHYNTSDLQSKILLDYMEESEEKEDTEDKEASEPIVPVGAVTSAAEAVALAKAGGMTGRIAHTAVVSKAQEADQEPEKSEAPQQAETGESVEERVLTKEEKDLFASAAQGKEMQQALASAIDRISMEPMQGNIFLIGENGTEPGMVARELAAAIGLQHKGVSEKMRALRAEELAAKPLEAYLPDLEGGSLIVEEAGSLSQDLCNRIFKTVGLFDGFLMIFTDNSEGIEKLVKNYPKIRDFFPISVTINALDNNGLVKFAQAYANEKEYSIDEMGKLALYNRIEELQRSDHAVTVDEVKDIINGAIARADKKSVGHFMDIVFAKRYDKEDMVVLREKDFLP